MINLSKILLVFIVLTVATCKNILAIDLYEALSVAYENNEQMQVIRRDFLMELEEFPKALANFLPNVEAGFTYGSEKNKNNSSPFSSTADSNVSRITLSQPVFRGGGSVAALKAGQSTFNVARGRYYSSEQKGFLNLIKICLDYVEAEEGYKISESSVNANKENYEAISEKMNLGEATKTDLAAAKSALAIAQTNKLTAFANLQAAKANFIKEIGLEPKDLKMPSLPQGIPTNLDELVQLSLKQNPDIHIARNSISSAKAMEAVAKSHLLPNADFQVSASKNHRPNQFRDISGITSKGVTTQLSVNIPIYSKGGTVYSEIRTRKNNTRKSVLILDAQLKANQANCVTIWESFIASKDGMQSANEAVEASQLAYDGIVEEERVGIKTILDVLTAEQKLSEAKIKSVKAHKDYLLAAYQMRSLVGTLNARALELKVSYFDPDKEFRKIKTKIIGF